MNCPHWLLALTIPFSRSDRAHTYPAGVGAGCPKGGPGRIAPPKGLLRLSEGQGRPFRRVRYSSRPAPERQRVRAGRKNRAEPGAPSRTIVPGHRSRAADTARSESSGPRDGAAARHPETPALVGRLLDADPRPAAGTSGRRGSIVQQPHPARSLLSSDRGEQVGAVLRPGDTQG